ncbi:unnamed protein product, partial [Rotaria sordida]
VDNILRGGGGATSAGDSSLHGGSAYSYGILWSNFLWGQI